MGPVKLPVQPPKTLRSYLRLAANSSPQIDHPKTINPAAKSAGMTARMTASKLPLKPAIDARHPPIQCSQATHFAILNSSVRGWMTQAAERALANSNAVCSQTLAVFCAVLVTAAANLAPNLGAGGASTWAGPSCRWW